MRSLSPAGQWGAMLVASVLASTALDGAGFPAAYLIGPMLVAVLFGIRGASVRVPHMVFVGAQALIGCLVAGAVTASILVSVAQNWALMLGIVLTTVLASGLVGWLHVRFGDLPGTTAAWGSSPGAAAAMVAMAEEYGADPRLVAFMQYLRVAMVVLSASLVSRLLFDPAAAVPDAVAAGVALHPSLPPVEQALDVAMTLALAGLGGFLGVRLRIPAGAMLVPMITGAMLQGAGLMDVRLPAPLLHLAYGALGWYIGLRFTPDVIAHAVRAIPQMLVSILAIIALCGLSAWLLTRFLHTDALTAYLATSPGGLDSVAIIAVGSDANISFVLALQTLRLFVVILTGPPLARLIARFA